MGADLYIRSLNDPIKKQYEPLFNEWVEIRNKCINEKAKDEAQEKVSKYYDLMYSAGYFRDAYNGTSILNQLGLSWWQDVSKLLDKEGNMSPKNAKKLLAKIEDKPLPKITGVWLMANHCAVDGDQNSPAAWEKSFAEHKAELVSFLKKAIELNEPIECSI